MVKVCSICRIEKPIEAFHKDKSKLFGVRSDCKKCRLDKITGDGPYARAHILNTERWREKNPQYILKVREWQANNPEKVRSHHIKCVRVTTEDHVRTLMDRQRGCCGVCGDSLVTPESTREYCIDHDHTTGVIRGLLCHGCNTNLERYLHLDTTFAFSCRNYINNGSVNDKSKTA